MRTYTPLEVYILVASLIALTSCARMNLPSTSVVGNSFQMEEDEKQLWENAEQLERKLERSGIVYKDRDLEAYLNTVAQNLLKPNLKHLGLTVRIKVIRHPFINAFALPHGTIYFHTGMLARMDNEAQLAAVLGHELTHITQRHGVAEMRSEENKGAFLRVLQALLGTEEEFWPLASNWNYSQELEDEADEEGFRLMVQGGYDPKEGLKILVYHQQELKELYTMEPVFLESQLRIQERIDNYQSYLTKYTMEAKEEGGLKNSQVFSISVNRLLLDNAALDLDIGRLNTARAAVEKHLKQQPHSSRGHFLLGELHRRSGRGEPHNQQAIAAYKEAVRFNPTYAAPHRELGLLYRAEGHLEEAITEFEQYLALSPKAVDAPIIQGYLAELRKP